jgi:hypothetical protein
MQLYFRFAEIKDMFERLKPEPGSMPFFHGSVRRTGARLFIARLGCQFSNYIMRKLKAEGINDSWATVGNKLDARKTAMTAAKGNGMNADVPIMTPTLPIATAEAALQGHRHRQRPGGPKGRGRPLPEAGLQVRRQLVTGHARRPALLGPGVARGATVETARQGRRPSRGAPGGREGAATRIGAGSVIADEQKAMTTTEASGTASGVRRTGSASPPS